MASSDKIVLYDLLSRDPCRSWSLNPWKTRLLLNYKGIPYSTQWLQYPDITPTLKPFVPPNEPGALAPYTIPAVRLPDGQHIMDSFAIALHLEKLYPSPSLQVDSPCVSKVTELIAKIMTALRPVYIPAEPRELLTPPSAEFFTRSREERVGMPLPEFEKSEQGGENAWKAAEPHLKELAAMYREDGNGPFLLGKDVAYADFVVVAWVKMFDRLGKLEHVTRWGGDEFATLYVSSQKWLQRDDH